jgi:nucleoside 2-deoxyribosyltransferase
VKIYLAGGFHSGWQDKVIKALPEITFVNPSINGFSVPQEYTIWDMEAIKASDAILAYLEIDNPSGLGLAFEMGYALGLGKLAFLVNDQWKNKYTGMLVSSATMTFSNLLSATTFLEQMAKI